MSQTAAYVDLMFAFGHARLGDTTTALELVAEATEKLSSNVSEVFESKEERLEVIPASDLIHCIPNTQRCSGTSITSQSLNSTTQ